MTSFHSALVMLWVSVKNRIWTRLVIAAIFVVIVLSILGLQFSRYYELIPLNSDFDLCLRFKDRILAADAVGPNRTHRAWWEWACLIESELDKTYGYQCQDSRFMGNWRVCFDEAYKPRNPCLVYSFGIANDFTFDDAMAKLGCEVFSFDPSMGVSDHQHAPRVTFKAIGLADHDSDDYQPNLDGYVDKFVTWKVRSLSTIRKILGHENVSDWIGLGRKLFLP